jgi:hypothetical protein
VTTAECEATMDRIRAVVSADLLKLPASRVMNSRTESRSIFSRVLDAAFRSTLERVSQPETYLDSKSTIGQKLFRTSRLGLR